MIINLWPQCIILVNRIGFYFNSSSFVTASIHTKLMIRGPIHPPKFISNLLNLNIIITQYNHWQLYILSSKPVGFKSTCIFRLTALFLFLLIYCNRFFPSQFWIVFLWHHCFLFLYGWQSFMPIYKRIVRWIHVERHYLFVFVCL